MPATLFQSTCPARGTTQGLGLSEPGGPISIHVPREGHDSTSWRAGPSQHHFNPRAPRGARRGLLLGGNTAGYNFNPRAPRGARQIGEVLAKAEHLFQSTCPARGTTTAGGLVQLGHGISIHVPREGHDSKHAQFFRADLRKSYKYPAERDALPTKNVCKHIKTLG